MTSPTNEPIAGFSSHSDVRTGACVPTTTEAQHRCVDAECASHADASKSWVLSREAIATIPVPESCQTLAALLFLARPLGTGWCGVGEHWRHEERYRMLLDWSASTVRPPRVGATVNPRQLRSVRRSFIRHVLDKGCRRLVLNYAQGIAIDHGLTAGVVARWSESILEQPAHSTFLYFWRADEVAESSSLRLGQRQSAKDEIVG